jgi:Zn-dependent protease
MSRPLGVIEDIATVKRIPIGSFWGVKLSVTPLTWLGPFIYFGLGLMLGGLRADMSVAERISDALLFSLAVEITTVLHAFGHILSGKWVRAAMDELLIASTRDINLYYGDQSEYPSSIHIIRSLGGPVFNLVVAGLLSLVLTGMAADPGKVLIAQLVSTNTFFGVGGLLPIPSVDGEVIWRELLRKSD